ncbi:MAG TPA: hypothetical protein PKY10_15695, partial [Lentisphaeria bacterium]|nr:hypothetical protein [Lentisphaeria bacterium]
MRGSVLEHRDVNIQGNQLLALSINPRELDSRQLVTDVCVKNVLSVFLGKCIQTLPKGFLRRGDDAHNPAEEKI